MRSMHPFMAAELPAFDLALRLRTRLVPLVVAAADPLDTLRAYAAAYVEQEMRTEGLVRQIGDFARFLEVVSFPTAACSTSATWQSIA